MRKYWWYIKTSIESSIIDRADILLYSVSLFVTPIVILAVWLVINNGGSNTLMTRDELTIYFLANVLVGTIRSSWIGQFIPGRIRRGEISPLLIKPVSILSSWVANNIAEKAIKLAFLIPTILFIGWWLSVGTPNLNVWTWLLVLITSIMTAVIYFFLDVSIGMFGFWLDETRWIQDLFFILESFFSGRVIPLLMLPVFWKDLAQWLPFRYVLSLPLEILTWRLNYWQIVQAVIIQMGYLILSIVLYTVIFRSGVRRYGASGA
jgi:ABC-2 type transport system permease protein